MKRSAWRSFWFELFSGSSPADFSSLFLGLGAERLGKTETQSSYSALRSILSTITACLSSLGLYDEDHLFNAMLLNTSVFLLKETNIVEAYGQAT